MLGQRFVRTVIAVLALCYVTEAETGQNGGYFYQFWQDQPGFATYSNGPNGQYSLKWSGNGDVVAGKGWQTGSARTITFDANYNPQGNSYMAVYGWTRSPEIEYYIVENYGSYNPISSGTKKGTVISDGSTYDIAVATRNNAPSISGTSTFQQFWSVRTSKRSSGTVTTSNHFEAWRKAGLQLGSFDLQIFAVEGYHSSGSATVTVGGGSASGYGGGNSTTAPASQGKYKSPGKAMNHSEEFR